jgi:uncharacterized cupin superfamily protein
VLEPPQLVIGSPREAGMKTPVREGDLHWTVWYAGTSREIRGKALCDVDGRAKVGVGLLELPPGSDTSPAHWHTHEEEHLYVLRGRLVLLLGERRFELGPGSYVCFPAGQEEKHQLRNEGTEPARYLMIGERIAEDRVVYE